MIVADLEYTDIEILHIVEVVDIHFDPSHDVWPILNLAVVSLGLPPFDPKSEPNIDSEMEPEDGPLYSFKWDTDSSASQNVTIKTTDTQNCGSRAIEKNSSSATVLAVIFENNCGSALWSQTFLHFLMTMVHPRASIGAAVEHAGLHGAARAARQLHRRAEPSFRRVASFQSTGISIHNQTNRQTEEQSSTSRCHQQQQS